MSKKLWVRAEGTVAGLLVAVVAALPACAATHAKNHAVHITTKETAIHMTPGPAPGPPSEVQEAGFFEGGTFGNGVTKTVLHPRDGKAVVEFLDRDGTILGTAVFTQTPKPGGFTIKGTATISGGTGRYAHAHGTLHVTGTHDMATGYSTTDQTGTLTY